MNKFEAIHDLAHAKGMEALNNAKPQPMGIVESDVFGRPLPNAKRYIVSEGACGFAWVKFKGNTAWGRWAKKAGIARSAYGGGLQYWISYGNQSVELKNAYAEAYAKVLNDNGIEAYADCRLD